VSTLFVCVTCRPDGEAAAEPSAGPRPGARLHATLKKQAADIDVVGVECLSNCERGCTAAVGAPGKWTYIVGHLDPDQHVSDLLAFARLHRDSADGITAWRDRPVHVRKNTIARVPPIKEMP
jgi:predicted metal-binding protein